MQRSRGWLLVLVILCVCGCMTTRRSTTTARTAVEQALLSQAAERTLAELKAEVPAGQSFFLMGKEAEAYDKEYLLTSLKHRLLKLGLMEAPEAAKADIVVYPRIANSAIDDWSVSFGLPALPLVIPGVGGLAIPELPLFKLETQRGRNRMGVYAVDKSGKLSFEIPFVSKETYYKRWVLLFIVSFRTTDLEKPF